MSNNALYYPHIDLKSAGWLKAMSLFYDKVYRIVPDNVIPEDDESLQALIEEGSIGRMIDPAIYSRDASDEFLSKVSNWDAAALTADDEEEKRLSRLHADKTDEQVRSLFREMGFKEKDNWIHVPTELASNYMLFLARNIAAKNNLTLIASEWGPWTATNYFNLDGGFDDFVILYDKEQEFSNDPFALYSLIISGITPFNIDEIPAEAIVSFREKRKDEIALLRGAVFDLHQELQILEDPGVRIDVIQDKIASLARAKEEYKKSSDIIKAKGWFGVSFLGFPAPVALGQLFSIPTASTAILAATGIAIGGIFHISHTKEELRKLKAESPASCLVDMRSTFKQYTSARGGGDMNFHAYNCMEEYVND